MLPYRKMMETLSHLIYAQRIELKWSQQDLSKYANVNQSTISLLESGERWGSFLVVSRVLLTLGFSLDEVYETIREVGEKNEIVQKKKGRRNPSLETRKTRATCSR